MKSNNSLPKALIDFESLPDSSNVRIPVVMGLFGISAATVWRNVKNGNIPKPRKLTTRTTCWNVGELKAFLRPEGGDDSEP